MVPLDCAAFCLSTADSPRSILHLASYTLLFGVLVHRLPVNNFAPLTTDRSLTLSSMHGLKGVLTNVSQLQHVALSALLGLMFLHREVTLLLAPYALFHRTCSERSRKRLLRAQDSVDD